MNDNVQQYLDFVAQRAAAHGVTVCLSPSERIPYHGSEITVSGYFIDRPTPTLAAGTGGPLENWLGILVHEASHMEQWIEQSAVWTDIIVQGREAVDWIDDWLAGENNLPLPIEELTRRAWAVEWDCERRALETIKRLSLPIDHQVYAQKANAYVYFYNDILRTRKWSTGSTAPYDVEEVWSHAPTDFSDSTGATPPQLQRAYERFYKSPKMKM